MPTKYFLLFGTPATDIKRVKSDLEEKLNIRFDERDSAYSGIYYMHRSANTDMVRVETNYQEWDQDWIMPDFKHYQILISFSTNSNNQKDIDLFISSVLSSSDKLKLLKNEKS
ncbi:hypothetical protein BKI52_03590 [marine bacterium AO1-C]|nr:hypothetical protein BKI52_03590 [marine bacterium AO1-C]